MHINNYLKGKWIKCFNQKTYTGWKHTKTKPIYIYCLLETYTDWMWGDRKKYLVVIEIKRQLQQNYSYQEKTNKQKKQTLKTGDVQR